MHILAVIVLIAFVALFVVVIGACIVMMVALAVTMFRETVCSYD